MANKYTTRDEESDSDSCIATVGNQAYPVSIANILRLMISPAQSSTIRKYPGQAIYDAPISPYTISVKSFIKAEL